MHLYEYNFLKGNTLGTWYSGRLDIIRLTVRLADLKGLFQQK